MRRTTPATEKHRLRGARVVVLPLSAMLVLAMSACTTADVASTPSGSPEASLAPTTDPATLIGGVIAPQGTTWSGRDSGGDDSNFTLAEDGTVDVTYGAESYDDPNDTWTVDDGVLELSVYLDAVNGTAVYTGVYDAATQSISATMTTTVSARSLTVQLGLVP